MWREWPLMIVVRSSLVAKYYNVGKAVTCRVYLVPALLASTPVSFLSLLQTC